MMVGRKLGCCTKVNPSGFSYEKPPPFTCYALWVQGRQNCGFLGLLFVTKFDVTKSQDNPSDGWRRQLPLHSGAKVDAKLKDIYL